MPVSQDVASEFSRATIEASFGKPVTLIRAQVSEALSELYTITADILCKEGDIDFSPLLGEAVSIKSRLKDKVLREFNGILTDVEFLSDSSNVSAGKFSTYYRLTIRPRLYQQAFNRAYNISEKIKVPDLVTRLLQSGGINVTTRLSAAYALMDYSVQYGESDFTYISRLLEQSGIYYYFTHSSGTEQIVLCDRSSSDIPSSHSLEAGVGWAQDGGSSESGLLTAWHESLRGSSEDKISVSFFDFTKTKTTVGINTAPVDLPVGRPAAKQKLAPQKVLNDSARLPPFGVDELASGAGTQFQVIEAHRKVFSGMATLSSLMPGGRITVTAHGIERYNKEYTITRLHTVLVGDLEETGANGADDGGCTFDAVLADVNWQPPLLTPVPIARGPETAIVVGGGENEEIGTDQYGRVKVVFHWIDVQGRATTSCWVRVSQTGGLGNIIMPRAGHEVIVDFLDGNPDRPLIVGRVFNSKNMPVYGLPAAKTVALWRTKTYGDADAPLQDGAVELDTKNPGANEIRLEDKSGSEEFFMHAQRDMNTRVRNNESRHIGRDLEVKIFHDEFKDVGGKLDYTIEKDSTVTIKGNEKQVTQGTRTVEVSGNRAVTLYAEDKLDTTGKTEITTQADHTTTLKGGNYKVEVKTGTVEVTSLLGMTLKAEASITLQCGSSKIEMSPAGIKISGVAVAVEGIATADLKAAGQTSIKGALVMIN